MFQFFPTVSHGPPPRRELDGEVASFSLSLKPRVQTGEAATPHLCARRHWDPLDVHVAVQQVQLDLQGQDDTVERRTKHWKRTMTVESKAQSDHLGGGLGEGRRAGTRTGRV